MCKRELKKKGEKTVEMGKTTTLKKCSDVTVKPTKSRRQESKLQLQEVSNLLICSQFAVGRPDRLQCGFHTNWAGAVRAKFALQKKKTVTRSCTGNYCRTAAAWMTAEAKEILFSLPNFFVTQ